MSKIRKGKGMKKLAEESTPIRDTADLGTLNTSAITDMVSHFGLVGSSGRVAISSAQDCQEAASASSLDLEDEAAKRRLDAMNKRLKNMEREMEALEAEVSKINASSQAAG
ncbi:hypothetical protein HHK36_001733 [Tetracentron sinense]|uniref:Uncharacterized protein n=1 Tax=Tetracentron sinense TaxID=13715 RepID=A0A834ZY12_TETSI|nr:hypothetical protein HHK36_001733 [Tetracentron sinense]